MFSPTTTTDHQSVIVSPVLARFNIPINELRAKYDGKHIVVGVAIFNAERTKLLIVQRASDEESFASMYELPGGHADSPNAQGCGGDARLMDAVIRETKEETGLTVTGIINGFKEFEYENSNGEKTIQFNFVVEVESADDTDIVLNPKEHQRYAWIGPEDDLDQFKLTGDMKAVVQAALSLLQDLS